MIPIILHKREKRKRPPPPLDEFEQRTSLMTLKTQAMYGVSANQASIRLPIFVEQKLMGFIGYHPLTELTEAADIELAASQFKLLTLGSIIILLLGLLMMWPFANHLLTPIRQLTQTVHQLASGDFSKRVSNQRQDELGHLQHDINQLALSLQKAQHSRNQWIADISHELRTPLTVLNGSIEAMIDGIRPLNSNSLEKLQHEVNILRRLIEDLYQLSLSDVGALQYQMQTLDFQEVLTHTLSNYTATYHTKGLALIVSLTSTNNLIQGDEQRLNQMLNNLLKNSLHYTDATQADGSQGEVSVHCENRANQLILTIADSSPSVSAEEITHLSERFFRTDPSRNRRTGGAGLGLAMVQQIVTAHQGEIAFSHSETGGLAVTITLPTLGETS